MTWLSTVIIFFTGTVFITNKYPRPRIKSYHPIRRHLNIVFICSVYTYIQIFRILCIDPICQIIAFLSQLQSTQHRLHFRHTSFDHRLCILRQSHGSQYTDN